MSIPIAQAGGVIEERPSCKALQTARRFFMSINLLSLAQNALGNDFASLAGSYLGESPVATQSAVSSLLPAVLGTVAQRGSTPAGAAGLMSLLNSPTLDTSALGNVAGLFSGGGSGLSSIMSAGAGSLVPALFGDKSGSLVNALSSASGIKASSATNLLAMVVPLVLAFLKKLVAEKGLDASSLASLLSSQGPNLQGALDGRLTSALGFASPAAFLGGLGALGGAAADGARRAGAAVAGGAAAVGGTALAAGDAAVVAGRSGLARWWPWLLGLAILALLWWLFSPKPTPPAPAPVAVAPASAPAPAAPMVASFPLKVYFDTGSAALGPDGSKAITAAADAIKKDNLKVALTGYTDKTGDAARNEELAKSRAVAVRDALMAAGVAEASIEMKAPLFVEIGAGMADNEARRVEISKL